MTIILEPLTVVAKIADLQALILLGGQDELLGYKEKNQDFYLYLLCYLFLFTLYFFYLYCLRLKRYQQIICVCNLYRCIGVCNLHRGEQSKKFLDHCHSDHLAQPFCFRKEETEAQREESLLAQEVQLVKARVSKLRLLMLYPVSFV